MDRDIISMSYSIDSIEQTPSEDERFSKVHIKAFAEGENTHTAPVTLDDLKRTAPSIYNIPIVVQFTRWTDDGIGTHDKSEVPVGFVYTKENPVRFEFDKERNKNFLAINGLLWNRYTKDIVNIIKKSNGKKKVSVEMRVKNPDARDRNGKRIMTDWTYYAITILSDEVTEACKGSQIELLQFAEDFASDKDNYINHLNFSESREGVKMENEKCLTNEAATCENGVVANAEEEKKDETPVLQSQAEEATPSAASDGNENNTPDETQACVTESTPAQMANCENDGASNNDVLESGCNVNQAEPVNDHDDDYDDDDDPDDDPDDEHDDDDDRHEVFAGNEPEKKDNEPSEQEVAMAKLTKENKNLSEENERLKADNEAYMAKIAAMSDYDELKQFKENAIAEEARMAKMAKVNAVFDSIAEKGINMSEDDKETLISKVDEYSDVDAWANMAKATIFDNYESSDGVVRIGLPYEQKSNTSESVWDRLASKFN